MLKKSFVFTYFLIAFAQQSFSQFTGKPTYDILVKRSGVAFGTINIELFPNIAPLATRNFDSLVSIQFYDSTAFHRVIPGFMIQGGDPNSRHGPISTWGYGDSTQATVNAEFSAAKHVRGILSAARDTGINSANSQFFICVATDAWLDGHYSIYGQVTGGMNVVDTIVNAPRDTNDNPLQKIEMFVRRTGSNDTVPVAPVLNSPASGTTGVGLTKQVKWNIVSDAIYYHVDVSTDSLFSTLFRSSDISALAYTVTTLVPATTYYWRVKTNNGGHWSPYSGVWNFSTNGVGIETYSGENPVVVSPNPSTGIFYFRNQTSFETDKTEVFNYLGERVFYKEGRTKEINLSNEADGIYFYSVSTKEGREFIRGKLVKQSRGN